MIKITAILIFLGILVLSWVLLFRKKESYKKKPFPEGWRKILNNKVEFYRNLSPGKKKEFESNILYFLDNIQITGVDSNINDTDRLLVSSSAVIPIFGFPGWHYHNLNEVLLYDGPFNHDFETKAKEDLNIIGMVGSGSMNRMMILSKPSLHSGFELPKSKQNVGIHEFVHLFDKADGDTDGVPEVFLEKPFVVPWIAMMQNEIKKIKHGRSDINFYGSKNESEFLSVVSEYFFQRPKQMNQNHPELFLMLENIFNQKMD